MGTQALPPMSTMLPAGLFPSLKPEPVRVSRVPPPTPPLAGDMLSTVTEDASGRSPERVTKSARQCRNSRAIVKSGRTRKTEVLPTTRSASTDGRPPHRSAAQVVRHEIYGVLRGGERDRAPGSCCGANGSLASPWSVKARLITILIYSDIGLVFYTPYGGLIHPLKL